MKKNIIAAVVLTFFSMSLTAQIGVTTTMTPNQLVQNVLLGFGVTATNVTVNGSAANANIPQGNATFFTAQLAQIVLAVLQIILQQHQM